jgi:predicted DNA-binding antitoxin AbrB/MazE fold protein
MPRQLDAVYENGVLRPLSPLALKERQKVRLTVDEQPAPEAIAATTVQQDFRREEMVWLAHEAGPYAGQWVALSGSHLIAHGPDADSVWDAARVAGVDRPLVTHLPEENEPPFGIW